jgi:hypothetical protein
MFGMPLSEDEYWLVFSPYWYKSTVLADVSEHHFCCRFQIIQLSLLFKGMRNIIVRYTLINASKEMRGIIEIFFIPMMHSPLFILAMRLFD